MLSNTRGQKPYRNRYRYRFGFLFLLLLMLASCSRQPEIPGDPKARLSDYIARSFSVKSAGDRTEIMGYLTGDAKVRLAAWSDDQFRQAFMTSKRQFLKLAFKEVKPINSDEVSITYEVEYLDQARATRPRSPTRSSRSCCRAQGNWYVADVHNIKELVEYQNEMSLP